MKKKVLSLIFFLIISLLTNNALASCKINPPELTKFVINSSLLNSSNPKKLITEYSNKKGLDVDCIYSEIKKNMQQIASAWVKKINKPECLKLNSAKCSIQDQRTTLANIDLIDQWIRWTDQNNSFPNFSLCLNSQNNDISNLTENISPILKNLITLNQIDFFEKLKQLNCEEKTESIDASNSKNYKYFKELIEKEPKTQLDDYLKLWYPNSKKDDEDNYIMKCQTADYQQIAKADETNQFLAKECKPDTLYSWGPEIKLINILTTLRPDQEWEKTINPKSPEDQSSLFTSISSVSTFGYGNISIRIKIKKDTPFRLFNGHISKLDYDESLKKVVVRNDNDFHDFTLSDASVIESLSFGTPDHYDEIVRELIQIKNNKKFHPYVSSKVYANPITESGFTRIYTNIDGHPTNDDELKMRLSEHVKMILEKKGQIIFPKDSCKNSYLHFKTKNPSYLNPN